MKIQLTIKWGRSSSDRLNCWERRCIAELHTPPSVEGQSDQLNRRWKRRRRCICSVVHHKVFEVEAEETLKDRLNRRSTRRRRCKRRLNDVSESEDVGVQQLACKPRVTGWTDTCDRFNRCLHAFFGKQTYNGYVLPSSLYKASPWVIWSCWSSGESPHTLKNTSKPSKSILIKSLGLALALWVRVLG